MVTLCVGSSQFVRWYEEFEARKTDDIVPLRTGMVFNWYKYTPVLKTIHDCVCEKHFCDK